MRLTRPRFLGLCATTQMYFCRQRTPVPLAVPTAIASPGDGAYVQFRGAPTTGHTVVSSAFQAQPQQIDCPRVTAKLREALDKQVAKREKNQSIVSYAIDFLNAVGVHNDTIMVVKSRILE
eukprot:824290-Pleurochrysis_carterae.AAC.1